MRSFTTSSTCYAGIIGAIGLDAADQRYIAPVPEWIGHPGFLQIERATSSNGVYGLPLAAQDIGDWRYLSLLIWRI